MGKFPALIKIKKNRNLLLEPISISENTLNCVLFFTKNYQNYLNLKNLNNHTTQHYRLYHFYMF